MGLDMYLERKQRCNLNELSDAERLYNDDEYDSEEVQTLEKLAKTFNNFGSIIERYKGFNVYLRGSENFKYTSFGQEVGYWRKANHIHKWFVDNVQNGTDDCAEYEVSQERLVELRQVCEDVLRNKSKASKLLPSESGFFFGGTDYDEYYFNKIVNTIEIIDKVLESTDFENDMITYQSSW